MADAEQPARSAVELGAIIRRRREALGVSVRSLGRTSGISAAHVSKIERGLASPSVTTLARLVAELGIDGAEIFGRGAAPVSTQVMVRRAADMPLLGPSDGATVRLAARIEGAAVLYATGGRRRFVKPVVASHETVLLVLDGSIEVDAGGERHELGAGDAVVIPPNTPHAVRVVGAPEETRTIYLTKSDARLLFDGGEPAR